MQLNNVFVSDLFEIRRGNKGAGNPFDPESLLSGKESAMGMTYENSHREWPNEESYALAFEGKMTTEEVLEMHPRVFNQGTKSEWPKKDPCVVPNPFGDGF